MNVPADFEVQPLTTDAERAAAKDPAQCGACGLWWDDGVTTSWTPTPGPRCPFEYFHDPEPDPPRILRVLDASTSHLPEDVCENLTGYQNVTAYDTSEGFLLFVPNEPSEEDHDEPAPEPLLALWRKAVEHNCQYILLDRDADLVPGLPTYDW